uniref:Secreted protein n=1 Tax=Strongyloides papillosus TaxID=174720 RepID=A0A0N5BHJ3_STREA
MFFFLLFYEYTIFGVIFFIKEHRWDLNTEKFLRHPLASVFCTRDSMGRLHRFQVDVGYLRQIDFWTGNSRSAITRNKCRFIGPLLNIITSTCSNILETLRVLLWTPKARGSARPSFVGIRMETNDLIHTPLSIGSSPVFAALLWTLFY